MDDLLVSSMSAEDANNDKQLEWCLTGTGSVLTAIIIAVCVHPTPLPLTVRIFVFLLLVSSIFGVWAKLLLPGDRPSTVSTQSSQLEALLEKVRPKNPDISHLSEQEQSKERGKWIAQLEYSQFVWYKKMLGRTYTWSQRNADVVSTFVFQDLRERESIKFRKAVQLKAKLINLQLATAFLGFVPITLAIILSDGPTWLFFVCIAALLIVGILLFGLIRPGKKR